MTTNKISHLELIHKGLKRQKNYLTGLKQASNDGLIDINYNCVANELAEIELLVSLCKKELATNPKTQLT